MLTTPNRRVVGAGTVTVGVLTAVTPTWAATNIHGAAATVGLGALAALHGLWALFGPRSARDHWPLTIVGLALAASPWIGGFAGDGASCVAWVAGIMMILLTDAAYSADDAASSTATSQAEAAN